MQVIYLVGDSGGKWWGSGEMRQGRKISVLMSPPLWVPGAQSCWGALEGGVDLTSELLHSRSEYAGVFIHQLPSIIDEHHSKGQ